MFQICCTLPPHSIFTDVVNWMHPASSSFCPRKFCMVCIYLSNLLLYWPCTLWFLNFRLLLSTRRLPAITCFHRIYFAVPTPLPLPRSPSHALHYTCVFAPHLPPYPTTTPYPAMQAKKCTMLTAHTPTFRMLL